MINDKDPLCMSIVRRNPIRGSNVIHINTRQVVVHRKKDGTLVRPKIPDDWIYVADLFEDAT